MENVNLQKLESNNLASIVNDINNGQSTKALITIEKLIKKFPNQALLFNLKGACYESIKELEKSIESFTKATEIHPQYAEAFYNLGAVSYTHLTLPTKA